MKKMSTTRRHHKEYLLHRVVLRNTGMDSSDTYGELGQFEWQNIN